MLGVKHNHTIGQIGAISNIICQQIYGFKYLDAEGNIASTFKDYKEELSEYVLSYINRELTKSINKYNILFDNCVQAQPNSVSDNIIKELGFDQIISKSFLNSIRYYGLSINETDNSISVLNEFYLKILSANTPVFKSYQVHHSGLIRENKNGEKEIFETKLPKTVLKNNSSLLAIDNCSICTLSDIRMGQ